MPGFDPSVADAARALFRETYSAAPQILAMAPGRVNLIGEHTDYQNGFVAPMALEKYTAIAARFGTEISADKSADKSVDKSVDKSAETLTVRCTSKDFKTGAFTVRPGVPLRPLPRGDPRSWMNYLMGVVDQYRARLLGVGGSGEEEEEGIRGYLDLAIVSSVPFGSGLSSSAALETAMAKVVEAVIARSDRSDRSAGQSARAADRATAMAALLANLSGDAARAAAVLDGPLRGKLNGVATALRCQKAEHVFGGVMCGIMDQYVSSLATPNNAIMIDCYSLACFEIPIPADVAVIVTQTRVQHSLGDSAYNTRVRECQEAVRVLNLAFPDRAEGPFLTLRDVDGGVAQLEDAFTRMSAQGACAAPAASVVYRRARHVVSENARVGGFREAMLSGDYAAAGACMYESHESLRDDYEVSCAELDELVEIARGLGDKAGVIGARMTGGGFGGCTVTMVQAERAAVVCAEIEKRYKTLHAERLKDAGEIAFVTAAGRGAGILEPAELRGGIYEEADAADAALVFGLTARQLGMGAMVGAALGFALSRYWKQKN
jgi:galactokinase